VTFFSTLFLQVEAGLMISLSISVLVIIKHTSVPRISIIGNVPNTSKYKEINSFPEAVSLPDILILRIEEALYYANIQQVKEILMTAANAPASVNPEHSKPLRAIIIDARFIPSMDASTIHILYETVQEDFMKRNIKILFVRLKDHLKMAFLTAGIIQGKQGDCLFSSIHEAVCSLSGSLSYYSDLKSPLLSSHESFNNV